MIEARNVSKQWPKIGAAAGAIYVALFGTGIILQGDAPIATDPAADIQAYFADSADQFSLGDYLISVAFVFFFLPFTVALTRRLAAAEAEPFFSQLTFAGGVIFTAIGGATLGFQGALAYGASAFAEDDLVRTLVQVYYYATTMTYPFLIALLAASSGVVILQTGVLWRWLGAASLLLAAVAVITPLAVLGNDPEGALGMLGMLVFVAFGLWVLATSVALWVMDASSPKHN